MARNAGFQVPTNQRLTTGKKIAIKAMLESGMSEWQVAEIEKVSRSTVNNVRHDPELEDLRPDIVEKTKKYLASRFYVMSDHSLSKAMENQRMEKMNSYQLTMMGAVAVDKARLMDGLSTENLSVRGVNEQVINDAKDLSKIKSMIVNRYGLVDGKDDSDASKSAS